MKRSVVFVIFPEVKLLDVTGALQVFADAGNQEEGEDVYDISILSQAGGMVATDSVIRLESEPFETWQGREIDTLLVAGGIGTTVAMQDSALIGAITSLGARSRRVGSICSGSFLLAEAGFLAGCRATTHWDSCRWLERRYPDVTVEADAIYVRDGRVWTSAGVTSGIDMALAMVAEDLGRSEAVRLARQLVTFMWRPGGQSQFSIPLQQQVKDATGRFDALHDWILENLTADLRVESLADRMNMSLRTFNRLYVEDTGQTPAKAVENYRLEAARQLLSESRLSVARVAETCGFGDDERLRRAFVRVFGVAPREYRQRFQASVA
ncbi:GlxA family transcriptional regulator [Aestuariispira insulae]|uniref:Transcriptional regulator GlxA family with amidase domain n=1 Tax=Aestuariispira insulae TaxID=1461337 RepID=A0A3D9HJR0_9PROT|nr:GlxA family transcriptional regulator [Aestuariispira insulae]RED49749.1 transcriptional regulator GlxA family with amidase domain [Aestuariispira insulae]